MADASQLACNDLVELVTGFLEEALAPSERARVEAHLASCRGCQTYFDQMRQTISMMGQLRADGVPGDTRKELLDTFRNVRNGVGKSSIPLGIGDEFARPGDHLAYFWESERDFDTGVSFLEVGLRGRDHCVVFGHPNANEKVLASLSRRGLKLERLIASGRLSVLGGCRAGNEMLESIAIDFKAALANGAPLIRLLGNIGWGRPDWPAENEIMEFEARVTDAARQFPCVIVCMYDVRSLPGRVLLRGGFETHPLTMRNDALRANPHYVPTARFLAQLAALPTSDTVH